MYIRHGGHTGFWLDQLLNPNICKSDVYTSRNLNFSFIHVKFANYFVRPRSKCFYHVQPDERDEIDNFFKSYIAHLFCP